MKEKSKYNLVRINVTIFDFQAKLAKENLINMSQALRETLNVEFQKRNILVVKNIE